MKKYRIYLKGSEIPIHEQQYLELPINMSIGETLTYSGIYKIIDVIHHISDTILITDMHVEKTK